MGGNNPPPFDPAIVEKHAEIAAQFIAAAGEWIENGDLASEEDAQRLNDFRAGIRARKKETEDDRKAAKKPHDDAGKAVQTAYLPILEKLDRAISKTDPILKKWMEKVEAERKAEAARIAEEARRQREEADRLAAQAQARNDLSGEVDAEAAMKEAEKAEKTATRMAKGTVKVSSATGGARSASLRTIRRAEITNIYLVFNQFKDHPDVRGVLESLATGAIRRGEEVEGVRVVEERRAV
jgi:D-ribose pyranose/furanose isomerase RbsD